MASGTQGICDDLQELVVELEQLMKATATAAGDRAGEAVEDLQERLARARARVNELGKTFERDVKRGARTADRYARDNTWASIGAVAVAAFLVGVLLRRRD